MGRFIGAAFIVVIVCLAAQSCQARKVRDFYTNYPPDPAPGPNVIVVNDTNWRITLEGEWMVKFHAPWCPACRALNGAWDGLGAASPEMKIKVGQVDVTKSPGLSGRFFVTALPSIYHIKEGVFRMYRGPRDVQSLRTLVEERQWNTIEAVTSWKHPDTFGMTLLSHFFTLSHNLKAANDYMQEEYDVPAWMAYVLFAVVTIFLGAIIGLVFVFIVDFLIPPRRIPTRKAFRQMEIEPCFESYPNEDFEVLEPIPMSSSEDEKYSEPDTEDEDDNKNSDADTATTSATEPKQKESPRPSGSNTTTTTTASILKNRKQDK